MSTLGKYYAHSHAPNLSISYARFVTANGANPDTAYIEDFGRVINVITRTGEGVWKITFKDKRVAVGVIVDVESDTGDTQVRAKVAKQEGSSAENYVTVTAETAGSASDIPGDIVSLLFIFSGTVAP